ncbi:chemotaxis protein CheW [Mongoliimonas terrestris]|uniref:chemotaxis protein CheW n=1 Tax=Mongoliimonas terrestris TaxID=1709001 RepID=UPI000949805D|nr:chemotaxis protein CheW [Mongoliimonas terrestris]
MSPTALDQDRRRRRLLDARTRDLAARRDGPGEGRGAIRPADHLLVAVGNALYGLPLRAARGVAPAGPVAPLPGTHPAVAGIVHQAGRFVAVVDLAALLGLPPGPADGGVHVFLKSEPPVALAAAAVVGTTAAAAISGGDTGSAAAPAVTGHARLDDPALKASGGAATLLDVAALLAPVFPIPLALGA